MADYYRCNTCSGLLVETVDDDGETRWIHVTDYECDGPDPVLE